MHSIRQNYGSDSSSSDSDSSAVDGDPRDSRASCARYAAARLLPPAPAPAPVVEAPVSMRLHPRPRPWPADDARAFQFTAYQPKRRWRQSVPDAANNAPEPPPPADASPEAASVFEGLEPAVESGRRLANRPEGRLTPAFRLPGHSKAVTSLRWNPQFPRLALSASMDATVRVWDASQRHSRRVLRLHGAALGVRTAHWSLDGRHTLSGGFDGRAVYCDVETGAVLRAFGFPLARSASSSALEVVTSVAFHPRDGAWVVAGTSRGGIHSFDLRESSGRPALSFTRAFAQVHDLLFLPPEAGAGDARLVSSADVTRRDASNQTLLVWDFRSAALLFDRLDQRLAAFQCLRAHPTRAQFVAQSAADCAALFSAVAPYKRVRRRQNPRTGSAVLAGFSGGHRVAGYAVQCSFSADGSLFATGDAAGRLVLYSDATGGVAQSRRLRDARTPVLAAEFSPATAAEPALMTGSYDGGIDVFRFHEEQTR